jgi:hypothetical protein
VVVLTTFADNTATEAELRSPHSNRSVPSRRIERTGVLLETAGVIDNSTTDPDAGHEHTLVTGPKAGLRYPVLPTSPSDHQRGLAAAASGRVTDLVRSTSV